MRKDKLQYLVFIAIGCLSFMIGFDIFGCRKIVTKALENFVNLPDIAGPLEFFLSFIVMIVLYFIFLFILRRQSLSFALKSFAISFFTIIILFAAMFIFTAYQLEHGRYLHVIMEDATEYKYTNITEEELLELSTLSKAINYCIENNETKYSCKISGHEWKKIEDYLENKGCHILAYKGKYFTVLLIRPD